MKIKMISIDEMKQKMTEKEIKEFFKEGCEDKKGIFISFDDGQSFHYMDESNFDFYEGDKR